MMNAPLIIKDGANPSARVTASIGCPVHGVSSAIIPRNLLQNVSDIRFPGAKGVEGKSIKTGNWGDLTALGARRIQWV